MLKKSVLKKMIQSKGMRVSREAIDEFATLFTEFTEEIIDTVIELTKHAGRKTVKAEDVKLAIK